MEALNDIGASEFLGVRTLTVSIYTTWVTRSDLPGAAQIALAMLLARRRPRVVERRARRRPPLRERRAEPAPAAAAPRCAARGRCWPAASARSPVAIGFLVPAAYLVDASVARIQFAGLSPAILSETLNTVWLSLLATVLTLVRRSASSIPRAYLEASGRALRARRLGWLRRAGHGAGDRHPAGGDRARPRARRRRDHVCGVSTGLLLLGSGAALVYAYFARFLAVAAGGVEAGFSRVSLSLDDAARTLGETAGRLRRIHLPMTRPALATAALLVFVDCMKELPATLLLRPLGFETLATHLYGDAARGTYEDGALAALLIVAAGLVPVLMLARVGRSESSAGVPRDRRATDVLGEPL